MIWEMKLYRALFLTVLTGLAFFDRLICQTQDSPLLHDTVNIDSQPSFGTVEFIKIDKNSGKIPLLSFHFSQRKVIDNSMKVSITVFMKMTENQKDYTKLLQTQGPACDLCKKSLTMKSFGRFGNLTGECPKSPGEYYVTNHYFAQTDFPPIPGRRIKVTVRIFRPETENDALQFTWTGKVSPKQGSILKVLNRPAGF
nr:PREDICTED: uncharacterized protein LOC109044637 isoform X1 [Bemisia tabaci]